MSSELLGAAQNVLKGNLGGAWDINKGYADAYTDLGIARRFGGSAVAYSLRDIGAMNGRVVKARRDVGETSDPEEDFSANQVSSGALEDYINGKLESTLPADVATAAAAYSLRKVKSDYTGNSVRIRRDDTDGEADVAFDSEGNVSNNSLVTVITGSGDTGSTLYDYLRANDPDGADAYVDTWYDQAGSNNAVQATAGNQPKIAESGALLADGLKFNGNSDNFTITNGVSGRSIFAVTNQNIDTTGGGLTGYGQDGISSLLGTAGSDSYIFVSNNNSGFNSYAISIDGAVSDSGQYASNGKTLSSAGGNLGTYGDIPSDTNSLLSIIYGSGDPANSWTRLGSGITGNIFMQGSMSEVILYSSDQSANRFKIESNINNYYGLYNDANEFSANPTSAQSSVTLSNVSKTGFTATIDATSEAKQVAFPFVNDLVSGDDYFVSFNYTTSDSSKTVSVKPFQSAGGSNASNDTISATNTGFYGGTGDASHNGFDVNATATVLIFQTTGTSFNFTVSNLRVSRIARNGFVETWYDQSGNGNNATQSGASNQPRIIQNGGQIKLNNGTPSLGFARDNSIRHLDMASAVGASEPYTFFTTTVFHGAFIFTIFAEDGNDNKPKATISATAARYFPSDSDDSGSISADGDADNIVSGFSGVNGGADGILRFNGANLKTDISRTQDGDSIQVLGRFPNTSTTLAHIESFVLFESDKTSDFSDIEKELAQPINIL